MGFWSKHPMDGDIPLEAKEMLDECLFSEDEIDADLFTDDDMYRQRLLTNIEDAINYNYPPGQQFVVPFTVARLGVRFSDKKASEILKNMIADGGAMLRGHSCLQVVNKYYKTHYNNFASPLDYANQLRDNWDDLMDGTKNFSDLEQNIDILDMVLNNLMEVH